MYGERTLSTRDSTMSESYVSVCLIGFDCLEYDTHYLGNTAFLEGFTHTYYLDNINYLLGVLL